MVSGVVQGDPPWSPLILITKLVPGRKGSFCLLALNCSPLSLTRFGVRGTTSSHYRLCIFTPYLVIKNTACKIVFLLDNPALSA